VYCVVRVPPCRFNSTQIHGWIPEDPTLPDKTFGWEPKGPQILGHKDWAASKDRDSEDITGVGGLGEMSQSSETNAQLEIDRLTADLNRKAVNVMRKGLEQADPKKAQMIVVGVSQVTTAAASPASPLQKLGPIQGGYRYWSNVIDQTSGSLPNLVGSPMLSGYSNMGAFWDIFKKKPEATPETSPGIPIVPDATYVKRTSDYIRQIYVRLGRLNAENAGQHFPEDMNLLNALYNQMRYESEFGTAGAEERHDAVLRIYKEAVTLATKIAHQMYNIGQRVDQPEGHETRVDTWWDRTKKTVGALIGVKPETPPVYPEAETLPVYEPEMTQPWTPGYRLPEEAIKGQRIGMPAPKFPWLAVGAVIAAAGVGIYLYKRKKRTLGG
jgi:hypothetical protein